MNVFQMGNVLSFARQNNYANDETTTPTQCSDNDDGQYIIPEQCREDQDEDEEVEEENDQGDQVEDQNNNNDDGEQLNYSFS